MFIEPGVQITSSVHGYWLVTRGKHLIAGREKYEDAMDMALRHARLITLAPAHLSWLALEADGLAASGRSNQ